MISIIVPNYNHSAYLKERLDSIFSQTYQNFEVIILDDCSTDHSPFLIQQYENHPKVKTVIYNKTNSGSVFKQWVKGLEFCEGDYIWIAETDDSADHSFLESLLTPLQKDQNLVLAYSDAEIIDENSNPKGNWSKRRNEKFKTSRWSSDYVNSGKSEIRDFMIYGTTINNISAALIRKSAIEDNLKTELIEFKYVGDWYFYLSLLLKGDLFYCSTPKSFYREHNLNTTRSSLKTGEQFKETIEAYDRFIKHSHGLNLELNKILNYFNYRFIISLDLLELNNFDKCKWVFKLFLRYPDIMTAVIWKWIKHKIKNK